MWLYVTVPYSPIQNDWTHAHQIRYTLCHPDLQLILVQERSKVKVTRLDSVSIVSTLYTGSPDGGTMCCWPRAWFLPDFGATWLNHLLTYSTVDGRGYIGLRLRNCNCYNKKFFLAMYMYCMLAWAAWIERVRSISGEQSAECFVPPPQVPGQIIAPVCVH